MTKQSESRLLLFIGVRLISMESQEGQYPALEWRGKSAKPHGIRTETVWIPYGFE